MLSEFIVLEKDDANILPMSGLVFLTVKIPDVSNEEEDLWLESGKVIITFSNGFITLIDITLNDNFKNEVKNEYPTLLNNINFKNEIIDTIMMHIYWLLSFRIIDNLSISLTLDEETLRYEFNPEYKSLILI